MRGIRGRCGRCGSEDEMPLVLRNARPQGIGITFRQCRVWFGTFKPLRAPFSGCDLAISPIFFHLFQGVRSRRRIILEIMPGLIRVSVLEAVDLPDALIDGNIGNDVTAKVILGPRFYRTQSRIADRGRIDSWNSEFTFPVMNLRDKLMVILCNSEDQSLTYTVIEIPSIIEKGCRDEFVEFEGGGRIHLRMSFVLTDEERKKIETMRLSTMKRRDDKLLKRTVVFQTVQPTYEDELRKSRVSTLTITEVDVSTTDERKAPKALENRPLGFGSTMKPLAPKPVFDYARAVGAQSSRYFRTNRSNAGAPYNSGDAVKANNDDMNFHGQSIRGCAEDAGKSRDDLVESANEDQELNCRIESQRAQNMLAAEATAMAMSNDDEYILFGGHLKKRPLSVGPSRVTSREWMLKWDGFQRAQAGYIETEHPKLEGQYGQGLRLEVRSGPGARWAQKSVLETKWTSSKKGRRILRDEWGGHVSDPLKARAKIFELIKAAGFSHESYGDRSFQEHHSIADSIGAVLHKVVGGAAMLLAAIFMMWPLIEGSPDGGDGFSGDDR